MKRILQLLTIALISIVIPANSLFSNEYPSPKNQNIEMECIEKSDAFYSVQKENTVITLASDTAKAKEKRKATNKQQPMDVHSITSVQYNQIYANIICKPIGLNTPVYFGDDNGIIEKGVGQYKGSGLPGENRLILMDSHNHTYFKPLQNAAVGQQITLETFYGNFDYTINNIQVYNENDLEKYIIDHLYDQKEVLILYTCYPFCKTDYRKTERLVVFAEKSQ